MPRRDPYYRPPSAFPLIWRHYRKRAGMSWWPNFVRFLILLGVGLCLLAQVLRNFQ